MVSTNLRMAGDFKNVSRLEKKGASSDSLECSSLEAKTEQRWARA